MFWFNIVIALVALGAVMNLIIETKLSEHREKLEEMLRKMDDRIYDIYLHTLPEYKQWGNQFRKCPPLTLERARKFKPGERIALLHANEADEFESAWRFDYRHERIIEDDVNSRGVLFSGQECLDDHKTEIEFTFRVSDKRASREDFEDEIRIWEIQSSLPIKS